jgi:hypothetical protein
LIALGVTAAALAQSAPDPMAFVVPNIQIWQRQSATVDRLLAASGALLDATAASQNALAERGNLDAPADCTDVGAVSLAWRSVVFGDAYRQHVQQLRMESALLTEFASSPAVLPLLDVDDTRALAQRTEQTSAHVERVLEAAAWHAREVAPRFARCPPPPATATPAPPSGPRGEADVAVFAQGGGRVCPSDLPADGRVVILQGGRGCWTPSEAGPCDCAAEAQSPAALLGPPPQP